MSRLLRLWNGYWFRPAGAFNLAASRAAFFGIVLAVQLPVDYSAWAEVPTTLRRPVALLGTSVNFPLGSEGTIFVLQVAWKVALACACVGLLTRASVGLSAALGTYLLSLPQSWGQITHEDQAAVIAMWILLFAACGDTFSVDAWLRRRRGKPVIVTARGSYHWPVQLAQVLTVSVLFSAGIAKLRGDPFRWVFSDNLATSMAVQGEANDAPLRLPVSGVLGQMMALGAISTEVLSPLALFGRWPRRVMVAAMLSLLVAIRLFLTPDFLMLAAVFVFWVPWSAVRARLQRTSPAPDSRSTT